MGWCTAVRVASGDVLCIVWWWAGGVVDGFFGHVSFCDDVPLRWMCSVDAVVESDSQGFARLPPYNGNAEPRRKAQSSLFAFACFGPPPQSMRSGRGFSQCVCGRLLGSETATATAVRTGAGKAFCAAENCQVRQV